MTSALPSAGGAWASATDAYDRTPTLAAAECEALARLVQRRGLGSQRPRDCLEALQRLLQPLDDVSCRMGYGSDVRRTLQRVMVADMHARATAFWAWSAEDWAATALDAVSRAAYPVLGAAYLLAGERTLHRQHRWFRRRSFASSMLDTSAVDAVIDQLVENPSAPAYARAARTRWHAVHALCGLLLDAGSADLAALSPEGIAAAYQRESPPARRGLREIVCAFRSMGLLRASPLPFHANASRSPEGTPPASPDVAPEWAEWCRRWHGTSTLNRLVRDHYFFNLLKMGRWLAARHPDVVTPGDWTRQLAAEWVATVGRMCTGDWCQSPRGCNAAHAGKPLRASTKAGQLTATRAFFRDCQEWEWMPNRFDPVRAFALPRSIKALIGPDPRVISDDVWAKLIWAGLNLTDDDLPHSSLPGRDHWYPLELTRAIAVVWLFAGLRRNEILRLRCGCVRWQHPAGDDASEQAVCLLDVPAHKTGTAYTKPIDGAVGTAVAAWEAVRPVEPSAVDARTGEPVHFLFMYKGATVGTTFINKTLIPSLCRKANVPVGDARGTFTSHRARATIATQLYNAREPMTLFELQAWLGHRSPASTQHYARITPHTLTKAYKDAGYFERNLRAIDVLIDREAVQSGAASRGEPWQYFDLGHGFCTYSFFDQCPHRMACARCDFYVPKQSTRAQLLEASGNLQRMRAEIPLSDEEVAAVDEGQAAIDRLMERLQDVPTPAGPTPRQLGLTPLPMVTSQPT